MNYKIYWQMRQKPRGPPTVKGLQMSRKAKHPNIFFLSSAFNTFGGLGRGIGGKHMVP